jgi:hypothetical protein
VLLRAGEGYDAQAFCGLVVPDEPAIDVCQVRSMISPVGLERFDYRLNGIGKLIGDGEFLMAHGARS